MDLYIIESPWHPEALEWPNLSVGKQGGLCLLLQGASIIHPVFLEPICADPIVNSGSAQS